MSTFIVPFDQGDASMADLLGGKGANLAEMTRLGLPVPAGFTITTDACREFLHTGRRPHGLGDEVRAHVREIERQTGRSFGAGPDPLLLSVRSGARFSMPGMMETVLDVGLTDEAVETMCASLDPHFVWDCYRRLVEMYGRTVLGVPAAALDTVRTSVLSWHERGSVGELSAAALADLVDRYRTVLRVETGHDLPQDPWEQLGAAIDAVFHSWNSPRAQVYRAHEGIPEDLGTAVNVMQMVYGNKGSRSGSGVCFTRDPATGDPTPYGDYLQDAQGEDVVNGSRTTVPLARLAEIEPQAHAELMGHLATLEKHWRDLCDVEFTVEEGRLWMLQTRVGKRSPAAAFVIASDMVDEGLLTRDEALVRVNGHQLETLLHERFDLPPDASPWATGLPASPGASVGTAVFSPRDAIERAAAGEDVVLVRTETSAEDIDGMLAARAVVTARGGLASHAAVVARGFGRTCVTGVSTLVVDEAAGEARGPDGQVLHTGDLISVDGTTGAIYLGNIPVRPSPVAGALSEGAAPQEATAQLAPQDARLVGAVARLLAHADERARVKVRVNAETADEAAAARAAGATGIGLCRTEHMLLGSRRELVEHVVLGIDVEEALRRIEQVALEEFTELLDVMDGLPVVVRLLDPPLHEFLPSVESLATQAARHEAVGEPVPADLQARLEATRAWSEANPMLGLRGVRLLSVHPELVDAHVRALVAAAHRLAERGRNPRPELMVPLVSDVAELVEAVQRIRTVIADAEAGRETEAGRHTGAGSETAPPTIPVGVMIELPRAALTAGDLAEHADFFSFGTNDLTQTTWGMSRDDAQTSFLSSYLASGLLAHDPFTTLDTAGVGELVRIAAERGLARSPELELGVCGEHGGDPKSIAFFASVGVDYVSCSAPRVPVARLEAGRVAVVAAGARGSDSR